MSTATTGTPDPAPKLKRAANRLNLDYRAEASRLGPPPVPIVDVHTHINGREAAAVYREAAELYGVALTYSMTHLEHVPAVRDLFGDRIRFIAVPNFNAQDKKAAFTTDWLVRIEKFASLGSRICKFWSAPRSRDYGRDLGIPDLFSLDHPFRREAMKVARECGMMFMTHIADPDTWFTARYADASRYGTKLDQYGPLERALDDYGDVPWIAAHMGGWPENLDFLSQLLERHPNLHLDTSATKWMVREVSKHPRDVLIDWLRRWEGRIIFGSDIVTMDDHLKPRAEVPGMGDLASSRAEAFDLYASRYFALRTMWETDYRGESPIVDPDLPMIDPQRYPPDAAPPLEGKSLPPDLLRSLYHDAATKVIGEWIAGSL